MSRNADRIQTQKVQEIPQQPLTYSPPTSLVVLPSGGKFYPEGHPLHGSETVEVKQMTTREEEILINQDLIKNGLMLDKLIKSVLVDNRIKAESLLIGDRNAIIVALRADAYGPEYQVGIDCPQCGESSEEVVELDQLKHKELGEVEISQEGTFKIVLPKTGATVEVRLLAGQDERSIAETNKKAKKYNLENPLIVQYQHMIKSVNGVEDPSFISSFIANMPMMDSKTLRKEYAAHSPDLEMKFNFVCGMCGYEGDMEVPISANFFWVD